MSCLFTSLANFHPGINTNQMRLLIVNYLSTNPKLGGINTSTLIKWEKNIPINRYIFQMRQQNQWGGAIEIKAYCDIFKINVNVKSLPNSKIIEFLSKYKTDKIINIQWNGFHYTPCRL